MKKHYKINECSEQTTVLTKKTMLDLSLIQCWGLCPIKKICLQEYDWITRIYDRLFFDKLS